MLLRPITKTGHSRLLGFGEFAGPVRAEIGEHEIGDTTYPGLVDDFPFPGTGIYGSNCA